MRDFKREETAYNQAVDRASDKIARQEALLAAMAPDDPQRHEAENILHQMRHNAGSADLLRSLSRYENDGG